MVLILLRSFEFFFMRLFLFSCYLCFLALALILASILSLYAVLRNSALRRFSRMGIPSHALSLFCSTSAEAPVISTNLG